MFARTKRLLLRPGWAEDAPALAAAIADEKIVRNLATAPWPYRMRDAEAIEPLERKLSDLREEVYRNLTPFQRVQVARNPKRPFTADYIRLAFTDFIELHGDRAFRDDAAIIGGWARLDDDTVMVIGHQRGRDTKEQLKRNFGMPHPEGYRKALRLMKLAEKFHVPVLTFIDTQGAWAGFIRFPAGSKSGVHTHSSDIKIVVVSGTFHYGSTPETEKNYGAGSYVFIPANLPHSNSQPEGALLYGEHPGKFDNKPVK